MKRKAKKRTARKGKALTRAQMKKVSGGMQLVRKGWSCEDDGMQLGPDGKPWHR